MLGEEVQRFEDLLLQQREQFAEEEIRHSFPKLLAFVLQVRVLLVCVSLFSVTF